MKKVDGSFNLPDGRLNPEKVFAFVLEKTRSMTPEEFTTIFNAPTKFQALANAAEKESRKPEHPQPGASSLVNQNTRKKAKAVPAREATKSVKNPATKALPQKSPKKNKPVSG